MAAAAAALSFADEPVADLKVAEFSGNATVEWGVDLDDATTGFRNKGEATLKVNIANKGSKSTSGEGIWAEIGVEATSNVGLKSTATATGGEGTGFIHDGDNLGKVKVSAAKLHFGPVYLGIMEGNTQVGAFKVPNAIMSADNDNAVRLTDVPATNNRNHGIVLGYGDNNFGLDVDFRSSPVGEDYYTNNYGFAAEAQLKSTNSFLPGLFADVGFAYELPNNGDTTNASYMGLGANAGYKLSLGEKFYLNPTVGYTMGISTASGNTTTGMDLVGGVLFGWGDTDNANAGVPYLDGDYAKKVTPGVGVAVKLANLANDTTRSLLVVPSFYSGNLIPNLAAGAVAEIAVPLTSGSNTFNLGIAGGLKYTLAIGDNVKIAPYAGARFINGTTTTSVFGNTNTDNGNKGDKTKHATDDKILNVKAGVEFTGLINNTTFNAWYQSRNLSLSGDNTEKAKFGTINLSCKIAL